MTSVAIGTPWVGTMDPGAATSPSSMTGTISLSGATNGEVVFVFFYCGGSTTPAGQITESSGTWNTVTNLKEGTGSWSDWAIFWKVKGSGDTSVTLNWTTTNGGHQGVAVQWPGVDTSSPYEANTDLFHSSGTSYATTASSSTTADRWAVAVFAARGTTSAANFATLTLTSRANACTTNSPYISLCVEDSNAAVTQGSHNYTCTGQSSGHGYGTQFYLKPASAGQNLTVQDPTDQAGLTDTITKGPSPTDSAGLTDSVSFAFSKSDSAGLTDSASAGIVKATAVSDDMGMTDAVTSFMYRMTLTHRITIGGGA